MSPRARGLAGSPFASWVAWRRWGRRRAGGALALLAAALIAVVLASCESAHKTPAPSFGALGGEAVARVGDVAISASLIARVARAQPAAVSVALGELVDDALAAQGARAEGLDRMASTHWASTALLARVVTEGLQQEARDLGPPRNEELDDVSVVHAVVLRSKVLPEANAIALAGELRRAVLSARSADEFLARAKAVQHPRAIVRVETLAPFDIAGRFDGGRMTPSFVAAAFALHPGETSDIIESPFGWHVIRMVARTPPSEGVLATRRDELRDAVLDARVRGRLGELLRARRAKEAIDIAGAADSLMEAVQGLSEGAGVR